jgi:AcrR family transcriptional regulator
MPTHAPSPRKRGRPPGPTAQGAAARERLYTIALRLFGERGYEATTLRDIAAAAGVSVGLLYRYFPSKHAVVLALHDDLSADVARLAAGMPAGRWRDRFLFALRLSLQVLGPHRVALQALAPLLVGSPDQNVFAPATSGPRLRVQQVFEQAVSGATDAPKAPLAGALGRLLYVVHLMVLQWWLLDRSRGQRATTALVALTEGLLPSASLALRIPALRRFVVALDGLIGEALTDVVPVAR